LKTYNVNINTGQLWDVNAKAQIRPEAKPKIPYQEIDSLIINLVNSDGLPIDISDYTSFEFSGDNDFNHTNALMIYSNSVNGDIVVLDAVNGKLKVSYNANTEKFNTATSGLTSFSGVPFFVELIGFIAGDTDGASLLRDTFYAVPRVKTVEGLPVPASPQYLNESQTQALIDGKQDALGFTPENVSNKSTSITIDSTDTQYASAKAVFTAIDAIVIPESGSDYTLPTASDSVLGGVKIGTGISIINGVISTPIKYSGDGITYCAIGNGILGDLAINMQSQSTATKCATGYNSGTFGGAQNTASGSFSVTLGGQENIAQSYNAVAIGKNTIAGGNSQLAIGEYNIVDPNGGVNTKGYYVFIAGNGTSTIARHNAYAISWSGIYISSACTTLTGSFLSFPDAYLWDNSFAFYVEENVLKIKIKDFEGTVTTQEVGGGGTGLTSVAVDGTTITGDGTTENPLICIVEGGSSAEFNPYQNDFFN